MSIHQPVRDQESSRQVVFRVEVDCADHAPTDLTYIDRARRAVLDADETEVSVTPLRE
jgi:hypothetical protein